MVPFLDRLSRNFEDGVRIQAELTRRNIGIVAIQEDIDTGGAPRSSSADRCWPRGPTRWIRPAADQARARTGQSRRKTSGETPSGMSTEQVEECRRGRPVSGK